MAKYFIKITMYIMFISESNDPVVNTGTHKQGQNQTHCKDRIYLNMQ